MVWVFGSTLFMGAFLLFTLQPLLGRMLLPWLGGGPSVWNVCLVFFQGALLVGYGYAHWLARRGGGWRWMGLHVVLLGFGLWFLPPVVAAERLEALSSEGRVVGGLLWTLTWTAGVPFALLAATAPTLMSWLARTAHRAGRDPHFLYVTSNAGSLGALVVYPLWIEPRWDLGEQGGYWAMGYGVFVVMMGVCGWLAWRVGAGQGSDRESRSDGERLGMRRWLGWVGLAFVPSSLVLGITQYVTTDLASVPLLWVIPLGLYLVTFMVAFARRRWVSRAWQGRLLVFTGTVAVFLLVSRAAEPLVLILLGHWLFLLAAGLVCHCRLADGRPGGQGLTAFYLAVALGGVLGGAFNALLAPLLFRGVLEYPMMLVVACALGWGLAREAGLARGLSGRDLLWVVLLGIGTAGWVTLWGGWAEGSVLWRNGVVLGVPVLASFLAADRPLRHALALAMVLFWTRDVARPAGQLIYAERTFFGVSRVMLDGAGTSHWLAHGNTLHGRQFVDGARECEPLAYYHRSGPAGDLFAWIGEERPAARVSVVGLGSGAMAAYSRRDEVWTFYEIDPASMRIAQDTNYFTYLSRCSAVPVRIVAGDARVRLREAPARSQDLLVIDAFSSGSIPVHLLTREALELYGSKLAPGGWVAFHISNRYLDLELVLARMAADAGWVCRVWDDWHANTSEEAPGREESHWVVMTREEEALRFLERRARWVTAREREGLRVWTDDFADVLSVLTWW
jgi:spermidine synthase